MEKKIDIANLLSSLIDAGKYKEALSVPSEPKLAENFKNNTSDVISMVIGKIENETSLTKPSLHSVCEELLLTVIQKASPEEALLEFIEQLEEAKNDAQFCIILPPLQQLLKKLSNKRGRSLEWVLNSISTYIGAIPTPNHELEGKERLLLDADPNYRRIIRVYSVLPAFYSTFIIELSMGDVNVYMKEIIGAFLISLLGKPIIYFDLDPSNNAQSELRQTCSCILQDLCKIEKDICKFLLDLQICYKESKKANLKKHEEVDDIQPYQQREKINMTTLSGMFYAVFSNHFPIPDTAIPQVYSSEYIFNTVMLSVVHLLGFQEYGPLAKALPLCEALLSRISDSSQSQTSPTHMELINSLVRVAIYSTFETLRKSAVKQIGSLIYKFEYNTRSKLIKYMIETSNHSGMIGYAITLYKNSLNEAFGHNNTFPECFTGGQLLMMLKKMCHLPHGPESDLVELGDQIITSLNFLRYLVLKDLDNITGIKDHLKFIESEYIEKLRIGLNMSKAHYEVKLKDLNEGKSIDDTDKVSISVGGSVLDGIPAESKKRMLHSALNAFHLIEGLIARLSECINQKD